MEKYQVNEQSSERTYSLYGARVRSDLVIPDQVEVESASWDVRFTMIGGEPPELQRGLNSIWRRSGAAQPGYPEITLFDGGGFRLLRIVEQVDFYITSRRIQCRLAASRYRYLAPLYFLGNVMSLWLEERNVLALHASAVVIGGRAVAFVAVSRGGKSTITTALMRRGFPMLTDDILAVDRWDGFYLANPGYPQVRMWPSDVKRCVEPPHVELGPLYPGCKKMRVHVGGDGGWGQFHCRPVPLSAIYLLSREDGDADLGKSRVAVDQIRPGDAVMALIQNSFAAEVVDAMGLQSRRLAALGRLVRDVPVRRLRYQSGVDHLDEVCDFVLADCYAGVAG